MNERVEADFEECEVCTWYNEVNTLHNGYTSIVDEIQLEAVLAKKMEEIETRIVADKA